MFQKLARIHALEAPIKRTSTNWLFTKIEKSFEKVFKDPAFRKELEEFNCKSLLEKDIKPEIDWCRALIEKVSANAVVLTHNDFRSSNLMITEPDEEVVPCDFEYACYGYRGHDFVNLYREWGREQWDFKPDSVPLANEETFGPFLQYYVEESERIHGKEWSSNPTNTVKHLFKEIRIHMLHSHLFGIMFMVDNNEQTENSFPMPRKLSMVSVVYFFSKYL